MTEPGNPGRLVNEPAQEPTGTSLSEAMPTRRSLRAQRDAAAATPSEAAGSSVPSVSPVSGVSAASVEPIVSAAPVAPGAPAAPAEPSVRESLARTPMTDAVLVRPSTAAVPVGTAAPAAGAGGTPSASPVAGVASALTAQYRAAVASRAAKPVDRRGPLGVIAALIVVPGLFLTVALPAYAFTPGSGGAEFAESDARELSKAGEQSVDVSSAAAKITVARDGYTAVTAEEIRRVTEEAEKAARAQAAAERRASAGGFSTPGQRQEGDDYPWAFNGDSLSPLGYYYRQCVDFVAWRLNRDAGATGPWKHVWSNMTPSGGSAWNWANAWESNGWAVSRDPIVGSVAWFTYNHVGYVQSVNGDGTVTIEEYNWQGSRAYYRRTIPVGDAALYLYPPP